MTCKLDPLANATDERLSVTSFGRVDIRRKCKDKSNNICCCGRQTDAAKLIADQIRCKQTSTTIAVRLDRTMPASIIRHAINLHRASADRNKIRQRKFPLERSIGGSRHPCTTLRIFKGQRCPYEYFERLTPSL